MTIKFVVLALYILMIAVISIVTMRKSLSLNEFLLGGRNIGPWMSALSYGTSYFSAVVIVGYAGKFGVDYGISASLIGIGNALIGSLFAWTVLAKQVRNMGEKLHVTTLPSFFEKRYASKGMKIFSSLVIFVLLIPYSASVYKGLGNVFEAIMGIDYTICVIAIALLASLYLCFGGYKATAITDFIQGIIMFFGVIAIILYIINGAGGLTKGLETLGQTGHYASFFPKGDNLSFLWANILLTSVGVLALPQMVHKFFAIQSPNATKRAAIISTVFALVISGGIYFAGGMSRAILPTIQTEHGMNALQAVEQGIMSTDMIMPTILTDQTVVCIPDALQGLFVVLLLSASISTLTALVLCSSSVITVDLLGSFIRYKSQKKEVFTMRTLCFLFVILSLVINFLLQDTPIVLLMSLSWGTIAGGFLAPFVYGLFWKKATKRASYLAMILGAGVAFFCPLIFGMVHAPMFGVIGMAIGMVVLPLCTLIDKKESNITQ